jgi:hypothetical protein
MGVGKSAFTAVGQFTGECLSIYVCSFPSFIPFLPDFSACYTVIELYGVIEKNNDFHCHNN